MATLDAYPELAEFLDPGDEYTTTLTETAFSGSRILIATQSGENDGGQYVFRWVDDAWQPIDADSIVEISGSERNSLFSAAVAQCQPFSNDDHQSAYNYIKQQVGLFSSKRGPDGGNLACVWAVRHLVFNCLKRWITRTDGTSVFNDELRRCYGTSFTESDVPAGGIIISPTRTAPSGRRNIGHVGLLGPPEAGGGRLVYSNSSRHAEWRQSHTVDAWKSHYGGKGLSVNFYPLPDKR